MAPKTNFDGKLKIAYFSNCQTFLGGAAKCLTDLICHLDRSKIAPYFFSIYDGEVTEFLKKQGVPFVQIKEFARSNPIPFLISQIKLARFIKKEKIDIIHNNQCGDAFYSWLPALLTNTKLIIHHRDSKFTRFDKFLIDRADWNISMSNWLNQQFLNNKAEVIHDGIDLDDIGNYRCEENHLRSPRKNDGMVIVGLVGRISPIKGQDVLIDAAGIILHERPNIKFLIIGDTNSGFYEDYYQDLQNRIKELGIGDKVEFKGLVNGLENIYPELDICVVPSAREPFGRVVVEAMAFCKPVIATNIGGPLDIVTEQTGIFIPVNNPEALADAIRFLADSPSVRESMGKNGRERVESCFRIDRTVSRICDLYSGLLAKPIRE